MLILRKEIKAKGICGFSGGLEVLNFTARFPSIRVSRGKVSNGNPTKVSGNSNERVLAG